MLKNLKLKSDSIWLLPILLLSIILNFCNLVIEGYANTYYAAGVKSMLLNFKNFFFVSSDPSGFVSIDKPPIGFWIQTISAKIFGFSGWSIILPQALAGVISVALLYFLVKKYFGRSAGLISALCLAVMPIFVSASRNNTIDNQLVLCLLTSCFFLLSAIENRKLSHIIISLAIVGIGFNIKMAEAYLILPAIYITYFLSCNITLKKKFVHLSIASIVLILVSLSWAFAVDLVPSSNRPFVGSSTNNSVLQLILGHNGFDRIKNLNLLFNNKNIQKQDQKNNYTNFTQAEPQKGYNNSFSYDSRPSFNNGVNGMGNSSKPSILRLFSNNNISDQISWLLAFALLGFIASAIKEKLKFPFNNTKKSSLIFWFTWMITEALYFSFTGGSFHTYYLTTMAPSIAALTGIGLISMWKQYNENNLMVWFLPSAFLINAITEILILSYGFNKSNGYKFLITFTAIFSISASIILYLLVVNKKFVTSTNTQNFANITNSLNLKKILVLVAFIGIILAPTIWSFTPMFYKMNGSSPSAGLELSSNGKKEAVLVNNSKLIDFLKSNKTTEQYLIAVPSANYASDIILESGDSVLTIGGFSGSDKIITLEQFKQLISQKKLRYALINENISKRNNTSTPFFNRNTNNDIENWIKTNGKLIETSNWQNSNTLNNSKNNTSNRQNAAQLYDLDTLIK